MSGALALLSGVLAGGNFSPVFIANGFIDSSGSGARTATVRLANDGKLYTGDNGTFTLNYSWLPSGSVADYDVQATVNSGSVTGTTGSWLNLATTRDWAVTDPLADGSSRSAQITLQIRSASTLAVLASAVWSISASREI